VRRRSERAVAAAELKAGPAKPPRFHARAMKRPFLPESTCSVLSRLSSRASVDFSRVK
jgi:hypothetical protein